MTEGQFWTKVDASGDCWLWTDRTNDKGYGLVHWDGGTRLAHRVAYGLLVGVIPNGLEPDHLCRVRPCVNPDHLEIVTHKINCLRGFGIGAINARVTHCPKGHPYDELNTIRLKNGGRDCKACHARLTKDWAARNHEHLMDLQRRRRAATE